MSDPLELAAVQQDDELLDRLGQGLSPQDDEDDTASVLRAWRADLLDQMPVTERSVATPALATPLPSRRRVRPPRPNFRGVAAAAGLVGVLSTLGIAAAASQATPGSVLFPLTKVVAAEHAESLQAREDVRAALQKAKRQAANGDMAGADATLRSAQRRLADVRPEDGRAALLAQLRQARSKVRTPPAPAARRSGGPTAAPSPTVAPPAPSPTPQSTPEAPPTPQPTPQPEPTPSATPSPAAAAPGGLGAPKQVPASTGRNCRAVSAPTRCPAPRLRSLGRIPS